MKIYIYILFFVFGLIGIAATSQDLQLSETLDWKGVIKETLPDGQFYEYLYFNGASIDPSTNLPEFRYTFPLDRSNKDIEVQMGMQHFTALNAEESQIAQNAGLTNTEIKFETGIASQNKEFFGFVKFVPIRKNAETGQFEKLTAFELTASFEEQASNHGPESIREYAAHSVLRTGDWYKFKVTEAGVYKLTYDDLSTTGINLSDIDPRNIRMYGNGGGMLAEKNNKPRTDDLVENAIFIEGENDGSFDAEDYILFFGESANEWYELLGFFYFSINFYDDHTYYYLTVSDEPGKRIESEPYSSLTPNFVQNSFNDYQKLEEEKTNLIESGKIWYGDEFGEINNRTYQFHFPHVVEGTEAVLKFGVANRTFINDEVVININDEVIDSLVLTSVDPGQTRYAQKKKKTYDLPLTSQSININMDYLPAEPNSRLWLDYIYVNLRSYLVLDNGQLLFRDLMNLNDGAVTRFEVAGANANTMFWEVTDPQTPVHFESQFEEGVSNFVTPTETIREFVVFDGTNYYQPEFVQKIENQDIHGSGPFEYIIVTHPRFREQAEQLKQIHETFDDLNGILVIEPEQIYNEFSSGKQDPTAIRDMVKMLWDKFPDQAPQYLLLFGDGSYDPKDRLEHNTNFIPAFQTEESWTTSTSYVVDDYYGLMDDTEGEDSWGTVDIGIGRFPVQTTEEADLMIHKIESYISSGEEVFGPWKNTLCIIADDEDNNLHIVQADSLSSTYDFIPDFINQRKIYLDAFPQIQTPSGNKYPDVTQKINEQVEEGALIINYIGHGGTGGWAHERIIQVNDIINWKNHVYPVFITATCEFSRFDEPEKVSAGEWVLLNENGGGVALLTTTRLAYSLSNYKLNERIYERAFVGDQGTMPRLGDIIKYSKPPGQQTTRNFVLLGDPALRISYPDYKIQVTSLNINGNESTLSESSDTIKSLQKVILKGEIIDFQDYKISEFNGYIWTTLFDKPIKTVTLGNDNGSQPFRYKQQNQVLWNGKSKVNNGTFEVSFVVPVDMAQNIDKGKLSFYASSDSHDATGAYNDFILWGIDNEATTDNKGPEITIFLNDTNFVSGDQTDPNPIMLARLFDENGINLSTNGIGHDITAVLNGDYSNIMVLNDYYKPGLNSYQQGTIEFPFSDLPNGRHTLHLKAWDSYNNSGETEIVFYINDKSGLSISGVMNHPNPFSNATVFTFKHTRPGKELKVKIEIFNMFGKHVMTHENTLFSTGSVLEFFTWDGKNTYGTRVESGIYLYNLTVTDEQGETSKQKQKLIIY